MRLKHWLYVTIIALWLPLLVGCTSPITSLEGDAGLASPADASQSTTTKEIETTPTNEPMETQLDITSPDGKIQVRFELISGVPTYSINRLEVEIIKPSRLGFIFATGEPLNQGLVIADHQVRAFDEVWSQPWGEVKDIREHYNELRVELVEDSETPRRMTLVFRVFDDGVGFRYELPAQENLGDFQIMDEETEFVLSDDHQVWYIPAYRDNRYEYLYNKASLSGLLKKKAIRAVHTPLTIETTDGLYLSIHEAALTDYASMTLVVAEENKLLCDLIPWSDGVKVKAATPHKTPWRTIQIAETPGELITSYLILNLNEPNVLTDLSWVKPGKYIGIWWGMHIDKYTFGSGERHGATTENAKAYIDFAAKYGFTGVLVEGWNLGWDGDWWSNGEIFDFLTPYDDFDIEEISAYGAERGVRLIGHHETGSSIARYESQMEAAFEMYQRLGTNTVKTGYVGIDKGIRRLNENGERLGWEYHHGQYMVQHYRRVVETAARYGIMLDVHEPVKDTGIRRTYPNMMTREGARGMEYNAWSTDGGNPPEHTTILPFTRLLAGPMDYTPGIFDLFYEETQPNNRVNTTLAKQLAYYVVIYSPLQMAADLPENYEGHPAFQFIVDVPVDWADIRVLHAKIGEYVTIARQDREGQDWYIGSITNAEGRRLSAQLDFLEPGVMYIAEIYADAAEADWESNPLAYEISQALVDRDTVMNFVLAPGGGMAIRLHPASPEEIEDVPYYQP